VRRVLLLVVALVMACDDEEPKKFGEDYGVGESSDSSSGDGSNDSSSEESSEGESSSGEPVDGCGGVCPFGNCEEVIPNRFLCTCVNELSCPDDTDCTYEMGDQASGHCIGD
jgi:hypothetical protein